MVTRKRKGGDRLDVRGSIWISVGEDSLGGHGRVALLRAVDQHGSITQAAKAFGMSYKAAWDAIDRMNELSRTPLIERAVGGKGGGSTRLTEHGRKLIERYEQVHGAGRFAQDAKAAGVDGLLVVDYPPEESDAFAHQLRAVDMDPIYLLAPTSTFIPIQDVMAERRLYFAFIGPLLILADVLRHLDEYDFKPDATGWLRKGKCPNCGSGANGLSCEPCGAITRSCAWA